MRLQVIGSIALFTGLWLADSACLLACSCIGPPPPREALRSAVAVFVGKVTKLENPNNGPIWSTADPVNVTFEVSKFWKGVRAATLLAQTAAGGSSCGYSFAVGSEYLVYAYGNQTRLVVVLCSRTRPLSGADEDLQALGEGRRPLEK